MMLKVGVLGYLVPLLFGFDPTHGSKSDVPSTDTSAVASLKAAPEEAAGQRDTGPAYLGLGTSRSNMQARSDTSSKKGLEMIISKDRIKRIAFERIGQL